MIQVVGAQLCTGARVTSDPYIPFTVEWEPNPHAGADYLFFSDPSEGYLELKLEPETGVLFEVILIDCPRRKPIPPKLDVLPPAVDARPIVDTSPWSRKTSLNLSAAGGNYIDVEERLGIDVRPDSIYVSIGESEPVSWIGCRNAVVGLSDTNEPCALHVRFERTDECFDFREWCGTDAAVSEVARDHDLPR